MSSPLSGNPLLSNRFKIEMIGIAVVAILMIVVFPMMNASGMISDYTINLFGKYLSYGLLAISVNMLWGYLGLLSLGQALFFSLGGYMMGMHLMRMIGDQGQYKKPIPDFLVFLGWTDLPSFWKPFSSFPFAFAMVLLVPGVLALVFGFFAFRSRIKGVYFSILTQALTYGSALLFFRNDILMGGNNGFTDFKTVLGVSLVETDSRRILYTVTAIVLLLVYLFCRWLNSTKFGLVQRAIRDSENRVLFSGYAAGHYKLFIFVLASFIAAIGGALYVPQVGIINPAEMWPDKSLEAVVWVAVGGRGTLVGPIIGAFVINAMKSWATRAFPDLWLIMLGGSFILVVLFMPKGIVGLVQQIYAMITKDRKPEPEDTPETPVEPAATTPSAK